MSFIALIPARMASTRLPDKPLADIAGKPMVVRVAERAAGSQAAQVTIATDDTRVQQAAAEHGYQARAGRKVGAGDGMTGPVAATPAQRPKRRAPSTPPAG